MRFTTPQLRRRHRPPLPQPQKKSGQNGIIFHQPWEFFPQKIRGVPPFPLPNIHSLHLLLGGKTKGRFPCFFGRTDPQPPSVGAPERDPRRYHCPTSREHRVACSCRKGFFNKTPGRKKKGEHHSMGFFIMKPKKKEKKHKAGLFLGWFWYLVP